MPVTVFSRKPKVPGTTSYHLIFRKWPRIPRRGTWWLMLFELAGVVPALVLFGLAQPNLYRTDMWQIGWDHRLNSNPARILYAYANHTPQPHIALVWTRTFTDFNVAISVLSLFMLLSKLTAYIMKVWFPVLATFINTCMVGLYIVSVYGNVGPDYTDSRYPAPAAWYFRKGCDLAKPYGHYKSCRLAQGALVPAVYLLVVYFLNLVFSIWAMLPNKENDIEEEDDEFSAPEPKESRNWEMHSMKSPINYNPQAFTPRTEAFHTLDRQLPLRSQHNRYG
ncbi:hypothetical protein B0J13DRAFT_227416 [Dactylonectria estremocensis]|uniref:Uncharacterized protein n=1 Tax=Dactylonectria estremocensis TaxID=1079267 RepID=A0A9P9F7U0_9HYPO|nr:hypothetical protein B0J13DRAFT_227416 [Dactylonectria estremocensis]